MKTKEFEFVPTALLESRTVAPLQARSKPASLRVLPVLLLLAGLVAFQPAAIAQTFVNPIVNEAADPWIVFKDGSYYMMATTGVDLRVRKSSTLAGLGSATAVVVWTPPQTGPNGAHIWAPELHYLNNKWYIYYTATSEDQSDENRRCFVLEAKTSDPQGGYNDIGKIADPNADFYAIDGHVYVRESDGAMFFLWSGRQGSGPGYQNIYIASMSAPNELSSGRVLLSSPTYNWERVGWGVNEGPIVLVRGGKTFIFYSGSGGTSPDYCLGLLTNTDGNLLNPSSWTKTPAPVLHKYEGPDGVCYAPGHNGFFLSPDASEVWIVYHGKENRDETWGGRHARAQKVYWDSDGTPNLGHPIVKGVTLAVPSGEYTGPKPPNADGTGLKGEYFDNRDFTAWVKTQADPTINYDWYDGAPPGLQRDSFSIRWTGSVLPRFSETYTFQTYSSDGVRLWVNGSLIIDNWTNHSDTANQGTITLAGGVQHSIELQYYQHELTARIMLEWKSPSQPFEVVPQTQLYPADNWAPGAGWSLVWGDEFNGNTVNPDKWTYDLGGGGWGNSELETYTAQNATVQDGALRITAEKNADGAYTSARLKTQGLQSWTYGKIAARLRLPQGQGIWPAFWMLGDSITTVGWPQCGEIDIMEMIGGGEDRDDSIYGSLHWDANGHASTGSGRLELPDPEIFNADYHVFEIEWSPTSVAWKVDGEEFARSSIDLALWPAMTAFHQPFFIVLNVGVGGDWPGSPDATTPFPQTMAVDWVRVYSSEAVATLPAFSTHPAGLTVNAGQAATFSVVVSGNPAPAIQWQKNGTDIPGATGDTFRIASATTSDAANYRAVATNAQGGTTSNAATLTVTVPPPPPTPPSSGGGGGGGGALSYWFAGALMLLAILRQLKPVRAAPN